MDIRTEKLEDIEAIRQLNIAAFDHENEANLVDRLRGISSTFSFVAVQSDRNLVSATDFSHLDTTFSLLHLGTVQSKNRSQSRFSLERNRSQSLTIEF
jgi:predicted N-acetyltransferase YhbS